jgi:CRISPR-associated protein Cmr5
MSQETAKVQTRAQRMASKAFTCVKQRKGSKAESDYARFAKKFPALLHSCGLAQALAFAKAKKEDGYLSDLNDVSEDKDLQGRAHESDLSDYMRLSRLALEAASWLKRYAEAMLNDQSGGKDGDSQRA